MKYHNDTNICKYIGLVTYRANFVVLGLKEISRLVSFSYRLSPEHVFPAGLDDCVTATKYFMANAERFGVDKDRIAVAGNNTVLASSCIFKKSR